MESHENQTLSDATGFAVAKLVEDYTETWNTLLRYDEDRLEIPTTGRPSTTVLELDLAVEAINTFKRFLDIRGEATSLFGNQPDDGLAAILGNVEQTMFDEPVYQSPQEKAANLLYFVIKSHPFTDGNKRIGALLFLLYLTREDISNDLTPHTLTALTLLIAESEPAKKDLMIRLIVNLITSSLT